jgi:hypothetical protein
MRRVIDEMELLLRQVVIVEEQPTAFRAGIRGISRQQSLWLLELASVGG